MNSQQKRRKLQLVEKGKDPSSGKSITNNRIARATVMGVGQSIEKFAAESDELDALERSNRILGKNLIRPPFDPLVLSQLNENSSELGKCVEAMEVNIDGTGGRLKSILPKQLEESILGAGVDTDSEEQQEMRTLWTAEWFKLDSLFNNPNAEDNLTTLRRKARIDLESNGNAYWEIVRPDAKSHDISAINHVESHSIRLGLLQKKPVVVSIRQLQPDFTYRNKLFKKRFRVYAQQLANNKFMWFKEWDDPRIIDNRDGKPLSGEAAQKLPKRFHATGLMRFKIHSARTPYGVPRYIGNLFEIFGSRAASEINFITFKNNNIPSMAVMVSGGMLTDGSIDRIEEFVSSQTKKGDNRSAFLILEADPGDDGALTPNNSVKMSIEPLTGQQHNDELFQDYDKNNREKIRESFRIAPIFVGRSDEKADVTEQKRITEEQVFKPERDEMDRRINQLAVSMGVRYWRFKSNTMNITNDDNLVKLVAQGEKTGGVTPNLAREAIGDVLNTDLPPLKKTDDFDPDLPMSINLMRLSSQAGGQPGGNDESGVLAPNQGQVPRGPDTNSDGKPEELPVLQKIAMLLAEGNQEEAIKLTKENRAMIAKADAASKETRQQQGTQGHELISALKVLEQQLVNRLDGKDGSGRTTTT